jgi:CRISPR-associated endonuclease/helicase Cas3
LFKRPNIQFSCQAFATAGKLFKVIDEDTQDILVPYNDEAKELILKLNSDLSPNEAAKLMRMAQKYTVSVYPNMIKALSENNALDTRKCGCLTVRENFYDAFYGLKSESNGLEILVY